LVLNLAGAKSYDVSNRLVRRQNRATSFSVIEPETVMGVGRVPMFEYRQGGPKTKRAETSSRKHQILARSCQLIDCIYFWFWVS